MTTTPVPAHPRVSVLLPVYQPNREWLDACVDSIARQTYDAIELVVVNDGSPASVEEQVRDAVEGRLTLSVHSQVNAGFTRATNTAYRQSDGDFVAPIGQDDLWEPTKIERQVERAREGFDVVFTDVQKIDREGRPEGTLEFPTEHSFEDIVRHCFPVYESSLIAKRVVIGESFLDPSFQVAGDWNLWIDLWSRASITHVNEPLTVKRFHEDKETSRNYDQAVRESEEMIRRVAQREGLDVGQIMRSFYRSKTKTLARYNFWGLAVVTLLKYVRYTFFTPDSKGS